MSILVIDVGTTTMRAALVDETLQIVDLEARAAPPTSPFPGLVEFDAAAMAATAIELATAVTTRASHPVRAVGRRMEKSPDCMAVSAVSSSCIA